MKVNNQFWLYPLIIIAGLLQAWGQPMNGALQKSLVNPWLASWYTFTCCCIFSVRILCIPRPLPNGENVIAMPWWAPFGGLKG